MQGNVPAATLVETVSVSTVTDSGTQPSFVGRRVGPFMLSRLIGAGGMGTVYEAQRVEGGFRQIVAIKLVSGAHPGLLERFALERQILADLRHPNIAQLLDGGETSDGIPYFAMEFIEGRSLTEHVAVTHADLDTRLALLIEVAEALEYAHRRKLIHRDIKPNNILVNQDGHVKLLDFGIAKLLDDLQQPGLTQQNIGPMTPEYAAPEQFNGAPLSVATDCYQFGVLLFRTLSGRSPYRVENSAGLALARAVSDLPPLSLSAEMRREETRPTSLSITSGPRHERQRLTDLDRIAAKCLAKVPQQRYPGMQDLLADLRAVQRFAAPSARYGKSFGLARLSMLFGGLLLCGWLLLKLVPERWLHQVSGHAPAVPAAPTEPAPVELLAELRNKLALDARPMLATIAQEGSPAQSPDGRWLAFTELKATDAGPSVWVRGIKDLSARRLSQVPAFAELNPRWSPDGQFVLFLRFTEQGCRLVLAPLIAGTEREIGVCESSRQEFYEFTPDGLGVLLFRAAADSAGLAVLQRLDLADGSLTSLNYSRSSSEQDVEARYAPNFQQLLVRRGQIPNSDLYLMSALGGDLTRVTELNARIRGFIWLADNRHVVLSSDQVGRTELMLLDTRTRVLARLGGNNAQFPDLNAATGRLVYEQVGQRSQLLEISRGKTHTRFASARAESFPALSPDGQTLSFISDRDGRSALYFGELNGAQVRGGIPTGAQRLSYSPNGSEVLSVRPTKQGSALLATNLKSLATRELLDASVQVQSGCITPTNTLYFVAGPTRELKRLNEAGAPVSMGVNGVSDLTCAQDGQLIFQKSPEATLFAFDPARQIISKLKIAIGVWNQDAWTLTPTGIVFLFAPKVGQEGLYLQTFTGGQPRLLSKWKNELNALGISAVGERMVVGAISGTDTDILEVEDFVLPSAVPVQQVPANRAD